MSEDKPLWNLLSSKGFTVRKEVDPELNPPNNRPVGHHTHNLLVVDTKSKKLFMLACAQSRDCDLKVAAKALGQKGFRMGDRSVVGVTEGCITSLSLCIKPEKEVTVAFDETLLKNPSLLMCAGCTNPLDHGQHNVCAIPPKALFTLLEESGTPIVSLQTGQPLRSSDMSCDGAGAEDNNDQEEKEEKSFQAKQLADVTALVVKLEKNDANVTTCDFAHKVHYLGDSGPEMFSRFLNAFQTNTVLTTIYLGSNDLGNSGASQVAEALEGHGTLLHLYLQYNHIEDTGANDLCRLLQSGKLLSLYLYGNCISCNGAEKIGAALTQNNTLHKLMLSQNNIKQQGCENLLRHLGANNTLEVLGLGMNPVGDVGAAAVARALATTALSFVQLSGCGVGNDGAQQLIAALADAKNLRALDLSASQNISNNYRDEMDDVAQSRRIRLQIN